MQRNRIEEMVLKLTDLQGTGGQRWGGHCSTSREGLLWAGAGKQYGLPTVGGAARTAVAGRAGEAAAPRSASGGDDGRRRCREAVDCCGRRRTDGRAARGRTPQEGEGLVRRRLDDPRRCRNRPCGYARVQRWQRLDRYEISCLCT